MRRKRQISTDYLQIGRRLERTAGQQGNAAFEIECGRASIGVRMGRNYRDVAVAVTDGLLSENDALATGATKAQLIVVKCRRNKNQSPRSSENCQRRQHATVT